MMKSVTPTTRDLIAWAAGFIDGEGAIVLGSSHPTPKEREKKGGNNARHKGQIKLSLSVWQTQKEPLIRLQLLFGGRIYATPQRNERSAPAWQWTIQAGGALEALLAIEPFVIRKAAQIHIARQFRNLVTGTTWGPPGMPDIEIAKRVALKEAMAILNQRGPKVTT